MAINGGAMQNTESPGSNRGLNLITPLFIGGVDQTRVEVSPEVGVQDGFRGCVKEVRGRCYGLALKSMYLFIVFRQECY